MEYARLNDAVFFTANFYSPSGLFSINADTTPRWLVYENSTTTPMLTGTMSARTDHDGAYFGLFHASGVSGFEVGKFYDVQVSGAVDGVEGVASVTQFRLESKSIADVGASGMIAQATWEYGGTRALTTQNWSTHSAADIWTQSARTLTNIGPLAVSGDIRGAIGLASANLDTQLTAIDDYVDTMEADLKTYGDANWGTADVSAIGASGNIAQAVWEYGTRALSTQNWSTHSAADVWTQSGRTLTNIGAAAISGDIQQIVEDGLTVYDAATGSDITGLNDPTAAAIADAVWDEDITTHVGGDKAGQALVTASGNLIGSTGGATAQQVWEYSARSLTNLGAASISGDIANAIWDEILASHVSAGSTGQALVTASGNLIGSAGGATAAQVWQYASRSLTNLGAASVSGDVTDAVWDEILANHINAGSTGQALVTASGNLIGSAGGATAAQVWQYSARSLTNLGEAAVSGDVQAVVENGLTAYDAATGTDITSLNDPTAAAIADAVWNETLSDHVGGGSTGQALVTASGNLIGGASGPDAPTIADAVWNEALSGHTSAGSAGNALALASGYLTAAMVWGYVTRNLSGTINDFDALDTALDSAHGAGSWATAIGFATPSDIISVSGVINTILSDTNELQTNQGNWLTADVSNLDTTVSSRMPTTHIDATGGVVDHVTLVDTTTTNTDMRGTDNAALQTSLLSTSGAIQDSINNLNNFDPTTTAVSVSGIVDVNVEQVSGELVDIGSFKADTSNLDVAVSSRASNTDLMAVSGVVSSINSDIYFANVKFVHDKFNIQDEYSAQWYKNDQPVASGSLTNPKISVFRTNTGQTVINNVNMNYASPLIGTVRYDKTAPLLASGEPYLVQVTATIDASTRTWQTIVGINLI